MTVKDAIAQDVGWSESRVSYVCMRPHHHRHQTADLRYTTYDHRRALCPAAASEGHEWMRVPELSLDVLVGLGWITSDLVSRPEDG